jgi:hypothetical protein
MDPASLCAACGEPTAADPCASCGASPLLVGRFRLLEALGSGRSGTTFRAVRVVDGAVVAIKEMPLRGAQSDKARALLQREARVLRELDHPRIPRHVEDFVAGRGKHAALFLVEELIEGVDLAREMERHRYDEADVLDVLAGILPVLAYLHGRSPPVIHRDLKPRNVMRRADGALVLLDFGAVRDALVDSELGGSTVAGTFGYMAPEQFRGDAAPGTDLYGLGALAVALLTRREPNTLSDTTGRVKWRAHANVSSGTAVLLDRLLDPDLDRRPRSAPVALAEVERLRASLRGPVGVAPGAAIDSGDPDVDRAARAPHDRAAAIAQDRAGAIATLMRSHPAGAFPETAHALLRAVATDPGELGPLGVPIVAGPITAPARLSGSRERYHTLVVGMFLVFLFLSVTVGSYLRAASAPSPAPVAPPATGCVPTLRDTAGPVPDTTSRYTFAGASADGRRVALALGRQSDGRGELLVYEAGATEPLRQRLSAPGAVARTDWDTFVDTLSDRTGTLREEGVDPALRPTPVAWCQEGAGVRIGAETWRFDTFDAPCALGIGETPTFQLCPPGAEDAGACLTPPRLDTGCYREAPRLVDVYQIGDAVWAVAERPHDGVVARFAAGLVRADTPGDTPK